MFPSPRKLQHIFTKHSIMTLKEATELYEELKPLIPGLKVKESNIHDIFIAPSDEDKFIEYINLRLKDEDAILKFELDNITVYGTAESKNNVAVPQVEIIDLNKYNIMEKGHRFDGL